VLALDFRDRCDVWEAVKVSGFRNRTPEEAEVQDIRMSVGTADKSIVELARARIGATPVKSRLVPLRANEAI
jgi:hypothetical protein